MEETTNTTLPAAAEGTADTTQTQEQEAQPAGQEYPAGMDAGAVDFINNLVRSAVREELKGFMPSTAPKTPGGIVGAGQPKVTVEQLKTMSYKQREDLLRSDPNLYHSLNNQLSKKGVNVQ